MTMIKDLITGDLGFCCLWAFFKCYRRTDLIATRLGFSRRAVQVHKARFKSGEMVCQGVACHGCMKAKLTV